MVRGVRGATTVKQNDRQEIIEATETLLRNIIEANHMEASQVVSMLFSTTLDLNAAFPAAALRNIDGWKYVPVMCMQEIPVPNALERCIRVLVTVNTSLSQQEIKHVYLEGAEVLRPDLSTND